MKKILIEFAHPTFRKSRINLKLVEIAANIKGVTFNNLYENYPDFFVNVKREHKLLIEHDIIFLQHPFYWYSAPALLKEWMDSVLSYGWAYGENGRVLENKCVLSVVTTGGSKQVYSKAKSNKFTINEFLIPYRQSAELCRMRYLPPFVIHDAHAIKNNELLRYSYKFEVMIKGLRSGKYDTYDFENVDYFNDIIE